jgi:hypothetical protein
VPASGMPRGPWMLVTQCLQSGRGKASPLVLLDRVRLVDPTELAVRADDVLHDEREVAMEVGLSAPPTEVPPGNGVLPGNVESGQLGGIESRALVDATSGQVVQGGPYRRSLGDVDYFARLRSQRPYVAVAFSIHGRHIIGSAQQSPR